MPTLSMEDVVWLTSDRAQPYLDRATSHRGSLSSLAKSLRKELTAQQAHLILEQAELRERARVKFKQADRMFFTRKTLQQATNEAVAGYVASRFPSGESVADLCCGIGGNLLALAKRGPATGVERDPVTAHFAQCNAAVAGQSKAQVEVSDAADYRLDSHAAFFIDPDRRAHGRRTVDLNYYQPHLAVLDRLIATCPNAAVKLAPATAAPQRWQSSAELEWIGFARECKQQLAWFGRLARHPGRRVATVCPAGGDEVRTIVENPLARARKTDRFGSFIYIPHAAVVTARLVATLAAEHSLAQFEGGVNLLTGEVPISDKAMTSFEAVAECPFVAKELSPLLQEHGVAPNIVRTIGRQSNCAKLTAKLPSSGGKMGGLFVHGKGSNRRVVIAVRSIGNQVNQRQSAPVSPAGRAAGDAGETS